MKKRGKDFRVYTEDSCPTCGEPCVKACRCPLNDRACKNNHWWRRDYKSGEAILLDGPHGNPIDAHKGEAKEMINLLQVHILDMGSLTHKQIESVDGISEVRIITDDGAKFHITQAGPQTINVRTPNGRLIIEPIAANVVDIKTDGI